MATFEQVKKAIEENKTIGQVLDEIKIETEKIENERLAREYYNSILFNLGIEQYEWKEVY